MNGAYRMDMDRVKRRRVMRGLTQARLAEKIGCDIRTVQRAEAGNAVSLQTLTDFAKAFGVEPDELLHVDGEDGETGDAVGAAFAAANDAIERSLLQGGPWGVQEITAVLALLLTRYGLGVARETTLSTGMGVVNMAASAADLEIRKLAREEGLKDV